MDKVTSGRVTQDVTFCRFVCILLVQLWFRKSSQFYFAHVEKALAVKCTSVCSDTLLPAIVRFVSVAQSALRCNQKGEISNYVFHCYWHQFLSHTLLRLFQHLSSYRECLLWSTGAFVVILVWAKGSEFIKALSGFGKVFPDFSSFMQWQTGRITTLILKETPRRENATSYEKQQAVGQKRQ